MKEEWILLLMTTSYTHTDRIDIPTVVTTSSIRDDVNMHDYTTTNTWVSWLDDMPLAYFSSDYATVKL